MATSPATHHSPFPSQFFLLFLVVLFLSLFIVQSQVPKNQTFQYINQGEFGQYVSEYGVNYRIIDAGEISFFTYPFQLLFYNTTPNAYVLALRAGTRRDEELMRWVWDANRNNPVRENATLTFTRNGNLVLAEADGKIAWQTNTANKGVTGFSILPNGNIVLYDKKGKFIWQSFDYPTDTLLVGQSVSLTGRSKLVSRTSEADGSDGKYSISIERNGFNMYLNSSGKLLRYGGWRNDVGPRITKVTFDAIPEGTSATAYELTLGFTQDPASPPPPATTTRHLLQSRPADNAVGIIIKKINYNATLSFIRLESDGNLRAYTYYTNTTYLKWDETYAFFGRGGSVRECGLPSKCGSFGYCDQRMCVACPSPNGLLGWSESCKPPSVKPCGAAGGSYYKIVGVEHFTSPYDEGEGPMKVNECRAKCSKDCKCVGFFYREESSKCLQVPVLGTLIRDVNTSHVGYIKYFLK